MPENTKYLLKIEVEKKDEIKIPDCDYELLPFCFCQADEELKVWNRYSTTGYVQLIKPWNKAKIFETSQTTDILRLNLFQMAFSSVLYLNKGVFMHGAVVSYKDYGIISVSYTHLDVYKRQVHALRSSKSSSNKTVPSSFEVNLILL